MHVLMAKQLGQLHFGTYDITAVKGLQFHSELRLFLTKTKHFVFLFLPAILEIRLSTLSPPLTCTPPTQCSPRLLRLPH